MVLAHLELVAHQDQAVHLAPVVLAHHVRAASRPLLEQSQGSLPVEDPDRQVVLVAELAPREPSVRVDQGVSQESQSAQSARNLNREKHRA